jgi:hypothetical protein
VPGAPVATTYAFWYRLARALLAPQVTGSLSGDPAAPAARDRLLHPPVDRLLVLDPRASMAMAVEVAARHRANLLLAELVGAARHHRAAVRVTAGNVGRTWAGVMDAEGIDFGVVDVA